MKNPIIMKITQKRKMKMLKKLIKNKKKINKTNLKIIKIKKNKKQFMWRKEDKLMKKDYMQ